MKRSYFGAINLILPGTAALLAGCALGPAPTVQSGPGMGKTFALYQTDLALCKSEALDSVSGSGGEDASNRPRMPGENTYIQRQYDAFFARCMVSRGESVPGYSTPVVAGIAGGNGDPVVRASQAELIRLRYMKGAADGIPGPKTKAAIAAFEEAAGLPADGEATPRLLARMVATTAEAKGEAPASSGKTEASAARRVAEPKGGTSEGVEHASNSGQPGPMVAVSASAN